jgi:hypothetical protein
MPRDSDGKTKGRKLPLVGNHLSKQLVIEGKFTDLIEKK